MYHVYIRFCFFLHRLYLCRPPPNECSGYDMKQSSNAGALANVEYPFIVIAPGFTLPGIGAPD